jgi:periplasmic copper chaperone A
MAQAPAQAPPQAADYRAGDMVVAQPWSRPTPPVATVGVAYFSMTNVGPKADSLIAISSPIARKVEIHESRTVQGMVQMRAVASVECPPGATVKIEPGGLHVMLLDLSRPLAAGTEFPLSLRFRDAGVLTVQVRVGTPE